MPIATETKTSIVDVIRGMYDMDGNAAYFHDAETMDEARTFAEGMRKIIADEEANVKVEQRNTRVLMSIIV